MEVVHFGLIRPEKGLEQVIDLAELLQRHGSALRVRIVGDVVPKWSKYFQQLQRSSAELPITWEIGLPLARVGEVLAGVRLGYLPFPDGASERRTSLLALLEAGVATITTKGPDTSVALSGAVASRGTRTRLFGSSKVCRPRQGAWSVWGWKVVATHDAPIGTPSLQCIRRCTERSTAWVLHQQPRLPKRPPRVRTPRVATRRLRTSLRSCADRAQRTGSRCSHARPRAAP